MSEANASAFVKSRAMAGTSEVNRGIVVRIICSIVNKKGGYRFSPFIYSVEAYRDETLTQKLGVIPKINSLGASTVEEWRLATVAAQTATKEIGRYVYFSGGGHYFASDSRGTITLTDVGIDLSGEQPDGRTEKQTKSFYQLFDDMHYFDRKEIYVWREQDGSVSVNPAFVGWGHGSYSTLQFPTQQERDRFFVDLAHALQGWKTKYARFQFAAGKLTIEQRCENGGSFGPCHESTLSEGKPVWQTPSYKVTVESLERNANDYIATLAFENLTDKTIKIAWQEKSGLVPDATGPYLIDESGEKYFAKGTDSGNILQDTMKYLWVPLPEILPQAKLKSRFLFSGNGDGKMFTLKAKEMLQDLGTRLVTIDGLKATSPGN